MLFELGYRRTILLSGVGSLAFGLIAVLAQDPWIAGSAFLGLGFSLSAAAPAAFGMSETAGGDAGLAIGAITTVGYAGFVVGPPAMGWMADNIGLRASFGLLLAATAGVAASGALSRPGPQPADHD
ncbi:MAG: MFS transporter [Actinomycetota bacterium]